MADAVAGILAEPDGVAGRGSRRRLAAGATRGHRDPAADADVARLPHGRVAGARRRVPRRDRHPRLRDAGDPRPDRDPAVGRARRRRGRARRGAAVTRSSAAATTTSSRTPPPGGRWDLGGVRPDLDPDAPGDGGARRISTSCGPPRWWTGPSTLIERIVRDRRVMTLAFAAPRARDVWRRIRFLVDQARLFEASQSADLVEFVAWTDLQRSDMARVHEPLLPESDDHAVRIMTMHGAKGLEFPITVLSGLTTEIGRRRSGVQALWDGDERPRVDAQERRVRRLRPARRPRGGDGPRREAPPPLRGLHPRA